MVVDGKYRDYQGEMGDFDEIEGDPWICWGNWDEQYIGETDSSYIPKISG